MSTSAWREPMVWLVAALPLATVAAGVATILVALAGPDASGADGVRRTGQQQTADVGPDLAASRAGYAATLTLRDGTVDVRLDGVPPATLMLALRHPADATRDRSIALAADSAGRWTAATAVPTSGDWNLELAPGDGTWRLVGRLHRGRAVLAPRFGTGAP